LVSSSINSIFRLSGLEDYSCHFGYSFVKSFRCYGLKLGSCFGAGPWAWCKHILLAQWTGVGARPGAAMQVWALRCRPQLENFTHRKLA